jgi:hypothetical protein
LPKGKSTGYLSEEERLILKAYTDLRVIKVLELTNLNDNAGIYTDLDSLLTNTADLLKQLSEVIGQAYFSHSQMSQIMTPIAVEDEL